MPRSKALRPRKRVGNRFEQSLTGGASVPLASPLFIGSPDSLFCSNVSGPSATAPASYNTFRGDSGGASAAGAPVDTTTAAKRPVPSFPFDLPLPTDVTNSSSSSNSSVGDGGAAEHAKREEEDDDNDDVVTISRLELERWQQKVLFQVEDHFSNEQLKRIAEFGRVHANLLVEAKQYVYGVEQQLAAQLEQERALLRAQAEAFVAKVSDENALLRARIQALEQENAALRGGGAEAPDTDMAPPSATVESVDQENVPSVGNKAKASGLKAPASDAIERREENGGDALLIKPPGDILDELKPVSVTPTSINQVSELEAPWVNGGGGSKQRHEPPH